AATGRSLNRSGSSYSRNVSVARVPRSVRGTRPPSTVLNPHSGLPSGKLASELLELCLLAGCRLPAERSRLGQRLSSLRIALVGHERLSGREVGTTRLGGPIQVAITAGKA